MKRISLYGIVFIASYVIRQLLLPNPFECFGEKASLINGIAGLFIPVVTFAIVGLVYQKGSFPVIGSILYLITYSAIVGFLWILGKFNFAWWWVCIVTIILILIVIGIRYLCENCLDDDDFLD